MQRHRFSLLSALVLSLGALPLTAAAQMAANAQGTPDVQPATEQPADTPDSVAAEDADNPLVQFPNQRPPDQRGLNTFEPPKTESRLVGNTPQLRLGGAFTQQFQALEHSNTAEARMVPGTNGQEYDANELIEIGPGFNLATANLNVNALLTDGVQVNLETYLSSRHHQER